MNEKNDILDVIPYEIPSMEEMNRRLETMEHLWLDFLELEGEKNLKYFIHKKNVFEVIKRQDERIYYYKIFHQLKNPCEYKFIAIECFWINTLKPFIVTDEASVVYDSPNEMFSLFLIISMIRAIFEIYYPNKKFEYPSESRIKDILYDFKFCSLSREAMISFVETFADTYGVGIDFLQKNRKLVEKTISKNPINALWEKQKESNK